jgi:class 3 adenylate cyclase
MTGALRGFLMSDLEGSNQLWATSPESMSEAVRVLDAEVGAAVENHHGTLLKARGEGDSHFAVFALASEAVTSACALQSRLLTPVNGLDLRARIAVHVGEVESIDDDYYGVAVNQTARLRAIAHGGQTVVSSVATVLAAPMLTNRVDLRSLGHHRIRDFARVEEVFQASPPGSFHGFPPLRTADTHGPALMAIAILDICSAGRIVQQLDEREVVALNLGWARSMRKLGEVHGATALRVFGDGCVAAFEDPLDSVAFAQDFRASAAAEGFEVKAGIDVGRVEFSDGEIVGTAIYRASRLERDAAPGQIVLSRLASELVGVSECAEIRDPRYSSTDPASAP